MLFIAAAGENPDFHMYSVVYRTSILVASSESFVLIFHTFKIQRETLLGILLCEHISCSTNIPISACEE
jgi:hypothetical protein